MTCQTWTIGPNMTPNLKYQKVYDIMGCKLGFKMGMHNPLSVDYNSWGIIGCAIIIIKWRKLVWVKKIINLMRIKYEN